MSPSRCLIVCNGEIHRKFLNKLLKTRPNLILISADGASNTLRKFGIKPDYIVGDLDSIKSSVMDYYKRRGVTIKNIPEQDPYGDLEKCLRFALSLKLRYISIIGYAGKRIDHTVNHFSILKRYYKKAEIRFLDPDFEIFYTNKSVAFSYRKGDVISFLGMPRAVVKTHGLLYPLNSEILEFGIREGVLNQAASNKVKVEVKSGELLIFKKHYGLPKESF